MVSCDDENEEVRARDPGITHEWMTSRHFGDLVGADRIAATVGDRSISFGEIAVCLEYMPALSPEECLNSLIDIYVLIEHATDDDRDDPRLADARTSGLANALLRERIELAVIETPVDEASIEDFLVNPETRPFVDVPELRVCSHLIVQGPPESDAEMPFVQRIYDEVDWSTIRSPASLRQVGRDYRGDATDIGLTLRVESRLTFPPYSDPPTHGGLHRAVREFSDALFAIEEVGTVSHPVATSFGAHIILLHEVIPERQLSPTEARALAVHELTQRARIEMMNEEIMRITALHEVDWFSENLAYLGSHFDDVLQSHSEQLREEIIPDE